MPADVPPLPPAPSAKPFSFDQRQLIGLGLGLLCIGVLIGFKLGMGSEPLVVDRPVDRVVFRNAPCADCAEKRGEAISDLVHETRAERRADNTEPQQSVPGDSSIPED